SNAMLRRLFKKKYVCVRQYDLTDCGAACLSSIAQYYGLKMSLAKIREMTGTDTQGTNAYGLIHAAKQLGFSAKGVKASKEDLLKDFRLPAIANVIVDNRLAHFVVIYSIKNRIITVADPGKGIVRYSMDDFCSIWTGGLVLLEPGEAFQKGDYTQNMMVKFAGFLKPLKKTVLCIFLASLLYTALGIAGSFYIKFLFDDLIKFEKLNDLHIISAGFAVIFLLQIFLNYYRSILVTKLGMSIDKSIMMEYYSHVLKLPMNFFNSRKVGEIISRFMDASKIRQAISGATLTIMIDTIMAVIGGILLYIQNSSLFFISFIIILLYGIIVTVFNKPIQNANRQIMEDNAKLTSALVESVKGIETIKSFGAEEQTEKSTRDKIETVMKSSFKEGMLYINLSSLTGIVAGLGGIVILWAGAYNVIKGNMSGGQLLAFNALLAYFLTPVKNLIDLQPLIQTAVVASNRLGEILELATEKELREDSDDFVISLKGDIEFRNVDFRYGLRKPVLKNINLTIPKGKTVAIVGESGSGKTTLAKLLMNFYSPEKGDILINGHSIKNISLELIRKKIAFVSQDVFIFSGTVKENLCLGNENVDMDEIIKAAKMANAHDFIEKLPLKYDTFLNESGANLSEGQKQRLAIARALLKKPDILILDEATSNLDSITENHIKDAIYGLEDDVTVIIIAHRLSTIVNCDKIYLLKDGEIVESGSHTELIALKGCYFKMWKQTENTLAS
uniref:ABC-type bacteriocin transporter n=1 Tax=Acetivibrio thermocellus (strain ATCC 27405 / DSM 1237 / JCM 9322 / NBRC 103400 / NCIMB 10682 / NRRL B-4536 / VPI 7372) TaxID=203119 RepID=UPI00066EFF7A|nr:Chain A, ABC-type bacteriocin transporter [Acetivibrio thermocellus ATCC 27405]4RY2_B Chain B, ABC-type bacteriocin transporter [Acetivibrio thermocellus ATCC 27405]7T54_A Chain A, ABC-type bacteriocin transporter [Acetivibrio thermocellus]7T54_B Chain B, ABC-type bacteriocin transporter [Acetivibrio thermocellus]7T55_A Chain A, ABC-type bacteriocin transporter [Acetivibrio thermocellus]7T55_B Chain B, ABC-type bacteriocin transporter [Acetivibrio thermocellus]7T56_A Chain A, ABC-type bact